MLIFLPFFLLPSSDWIALNVLRNVALSINSVAASVEPNMQSQFLALSPSGAHFSSHPSSSATRTRAPPTQLVPRPTDRPRPIRYR